MPEKKPPKNCPAKQSKKEKEKSRQPPKAVKMTCPPLAEQKSPKITLKYQNKLP
jgi:hypothetical protein